MSSLRKKLKNQYSQLDRQLSDRRHALSEQFSNFGEERLLKKYVSELLDGGRDRTIVDIGAGDGIRRSNSYRLISEGWRGIGFEYDVSAFVKLSKAYRHFPNAFACRACIGTGNVSQLLKGFNVEREFDVLSLDIDGNDFWILDRVLEDFRPGIIISEINEKIPPPLRFVVKYNPDFTLRHHFYGYSISMLDSLLSRHRYSIIDLEYNNVFLAPTELAGSRAIDIETAYQKGYAARPDRREKLPDNQDMEGLLTMSPAEGVRFLHRFYSRFEGEYDLSEG
jgi:hypothetical protein